MPVEDRPEKTDAIVWEQRGSPAVTSVLALLVVLLSTLYGYPAQPCPACGDVRAQAAWAGRRSCALRCGCCSAWQCTACTACTRQRPKRDTCLFRVHRPRAGGPKPPDKPIAQLRRPLLCSSIHGLQWNKSGGGLHRLYGTLTERISAAFPLVKQLACAHPHPVAASAWQAPRGGSRGDAGWAGQQQQPGRCSRAGIDGRA